MSGDTLLLAASHLVVWSVLLVPTIRSMARGWRPLGDDAAIGIGAWRALTLHPPLLGTATAITGGKITSVSDPGPLKFWLRSVRAPLPGAGSASRIGAAVRRCSVTQRAPALASLWAVGGRRLLLGCRRPGNNVSDALPRPGVELFVRLLVVHCLSRDRLRRWNGEPAIHSASSLRGLGEHRFPSAVPSIRRPRAGRLRRLRMDVATTTQSPMALVDDRGGIRVLGRAALPAAFQAEPQRVLPGVKFGTERR